MCVAGIEKGGFNIRENCLDLTNIISAYAGYFKNDDKLMCSSSGGIATALAEDALERGGIVYGAAYSADFYFAHYLRVNSMSDLHRLKGSKYVYVEKKVEYENKWESVYEAVYMDLLKGKKVLFFGLGCDVSAVLAFCKNQGMGAEKLYTVELLCDGVTNENVHAEYIKGIEELYDSKIIEFTVRNKRDGWVPPYICAKFSNGSEHIVPFYHTAYGYAFTSYKRKSCYHCAFKGKKHFADLTIGDFWGCNTGMKEYNPNGVSIIFVQTIRGKKLLEEIDGNNFELVETNPEYALWYNPRYLNAHPYNPCWEEFDSCIREKGLHEAVRICSGTYISNRNGYRNNNNIVLWGTGNCFHKLAPYVMRRAEIMCVVDSDFKKWGHATEYGMVCESPETIRNKDVFVIIMNDSAPAVCQIANRLIDMGLMNFDHIDNWIKNIM